MKATLALGNVLSVKLFLLLDPFVIQEKATGQHTVSIGEVVNIGTIGGGSDSETVPPESKGAVIALESAKGDIIFLRKLVGLRHLFVGKDFKNAYVSLLGECFNAGIRTDLPGVVFSRPEKNMEKLVFFRGFFRFFPSLLFSLFFLRKKRFVTKSKVYVKEV